MIEATASDMARAFHEFLDKAQQGETVLIRKHGKAVARLVPDSDFRPPDIASNFQGIPIFLRNEPVLCYCVLRARAQERLHTLQFIPPRTLTILATVPDSSHGTAIAP